MKKFGKTGVLIAGLAALCVLPVLAGNAPSAAQAERGAVQAETVLPEERAPRAWIVNMSLNLYADASHVRAEAKNDFTFPMATVYTVVKLYSSATYTEDVSAMTLEAQNSIADLDTGKSISAQVAIGGRERYWRAQMMYQADNGALNYKETDTFRISANGTVLP